MPNSQKLLKVSSVAKTLYLRHKDFLENEKRFQTELERDDFIWHSLIRSFSTMGKSSGWASLTKNMNNYDQLKFPNLKLLPRVERRKVVKSVCRAGKLRMPHKKASFIL